MNLIFSWLLTYLLHSSLLLAMALMVTGLMKKRGLPAQEFLLKVALLGGLFTASLGSALNYNQVEFKLNRTHAIVVDTTPVVVPSPMVVEDVLGSKAKKRNPILVQKDEKPFQFMALLQSWATPIVLLWLLGASSLLGLLCHAGFRLNRLLANRYRLTDDKLTLVLAQLVSGTHYHKLIELSASRKLKVPIAKGVFKAEICVPEQVRLLKEKQQASLLAHEVAHHLHGDPFWVLLGQVVSRLFFFQPLNRLVFHRLVAISEYRCDDWAASKTGEPLALARCLTEVADWNRQLYLVPSMAGSKNDLSKRVSRLLENESGSWHYLPHWLKGTIMFFLIIFAILLPGYTQAPASSDTLVQSAQEEAPKPAVAPLVTVPTVTPVKVKAPKIKGEKNKPVKAKAPKVVYKPVKVKASDKVPRIMAEVPAPEIAPKAAVHIAAVVPAAPLVAEVVPAQEVAPQAPNAVVPSSDEAAEDAFEAWEESLEASLEVVENKLDRYDDMMDELIDQAEEVYEEKYEDDPAEEIGSKKLNKISEEWFQLIDTLEERLESIEETVDETVEVYEENPNSLSDSVRVQIESNLLKELNRFDSELIRTYNLHKEKVTAFLKKLK